MKILRFLAVLVLAMICLPAPASAAQTNFSRKKELYDTKADGKVLIKKSLAKAQKENKTVLLKFGANWCVWCVSLSDLFKEDKEIAKILRQNYIVVLIDVDKEHNADVKAHYGNPTEKGIPALVVLDKNGKQLHSQETESLESGKSHSPEKVKEFLNQWKPKAAAGEKQK